MRSVNVRSLTAAVLLGTTALIPLRVSAQTWVGSTSIYTAPTNWTTGSIPSTSADTATFSSTGSTSVLIAGASFSVAGFTFDNTAQIYTITLSGTSALTFTGSGIVNNTGRTQSVIANGASTSIVLNNAASLSSTKVSLQSGATLRLADNASGGTAAITSSAASSIDVSGLSAAGTSIGSLSGSGTVNLGTKQLTVGGNDQSTAYTGAIGGTGSVVKTGNGTWTLSGTNSYSGGTTLQGGTISVAGNSSLGNASGALVFDGGTLQTTVTFSMARATTLNAGGGTMNVASGTTLTQSGIVGGTGGLTKTGAGTLVLSAANSFTGTTTVTAGTLRLGTGGSLSSTGGLTVDGGTFDLNGHVQTVGTLSGAGGTIALGSGELTVISDRSATLASQITGTGDLVVGGAGTLTLTGVNTYSGGTTVSGPGALAFSSADNFGPGTVFVRNGSLQWVAGNTTDLSVVRTITMMGGQLDTNGNDVTLAGTIGGPDALIKVGAGTLSLRGANSYGSGTGIYGGLINFVSASNFSGSGIYFASGGGLQWAPGNTIDISASQPLIMTTGGGVLDTNGNNVTLASSITGTDSLTKAGGGTLTLRGVNSYVGTIVTGGLINFATSGNLGTGTITLSGGGLQWATGTSTDISSRLAPLGPGGGTLDTNGNTVTLASPITGGGGLVKTGQGTLILGGSNSYSGGTTVMAGTVQGTTSSLQGNIVNNAAVVFSQSGNGTYAGAMSGTGSLLVNGTGTVTLSGANSYSGGTTVTGGTLLGTTSSLQGNIANSAAVVFNQSGSGTYTGAISGTGSVGIQGGGVLTLTGASTYTGPTSVTGSGLVVNGSLASAVTLDGASTISGTGSLGGLTVNGGTLAPGNNSIGTLTVNGGFAQNGGSYVLAVNAQGQNNTVAVNGAATINGGTVQLAAAPGNYSTGQTYTILSATGGVGGAYSGVVTDFAFLTPSLSYTANSVLLTLALQGGTPFSGFGGNTANQRAVGTALDRSYATASGDFATVIGALASLNTQQAGPALTAISGQSYADTGTATVGASFLFLNALGQQIAVARGKGEAGTRIALAEACDVACDDAPSTRLSAWMSGVGGFGSIGGNGNAGALTYNFGGAAAGIDYRLDPRFLLGLAVSYASGRQWVDGFNGQGNSNNYSAALYASFTQSGFYADALAGYAYSNTQMQRVMAIPGLQPRIANGSAGANQFLGQLEAGYGIGVYQPAQAILTPFARFQTVAAAQNGFTESGSANALGLIVAAQNTTSVRTVLGADLAGNIPVGATNPLAITLRLGWAHEYASTDRPMTASFQGAPSASFTVYGAQPQRDSAVIGLGLQTQLAAAMSLYARYDGEISGRDNAHAVTAGLRMSW